MCPTFRIFLKKSRHEPPTDKLACTLLECEDFHVNLLYLYICISNLVNRNMIGLKEDSEFSWLQIQWSGYFLPPRPAQKQMLLLIKNTISVH